MTSAVPASTTGAASSARTVSALTTSGVPSLAMTTSEPLVTFKVSTSAGAFSPPGVFFSSMGSPFLRSAPLQNDAPIVAARAQAPGNGSATDGRLGASPSEPPNDPGPLRPRARGTCGR